jgi:hypothetical protein
MRILWAVAVDLYHFAHDALFGVMRQSEVRSAPQQPPASHSFANVPRSDLLHGTLAFIGEEGVRLFTDPVVAFDGAICDVSYGDTVYVQRFQGRFAEVRYGSLSGWILRDALRESLRDIAPSFAPGERFDAQSEEAQKLRRYIGDAFLGGEVGIDLTDVEYVTYRLRQKGIAVPWRSERPRTAGIWQKLLRGIPSVRIGIAPRTDAVMEYLEEERGHVLFVEAVYPDESIKVSTFGREEEGVYTEAVWEKETYREFRPVFISFT